MKEGRYSEYLPLLEETYNFNSYLHSLRQTFISLETYSRTFQISFAKDPHYSRSMKYRNSILTLSTTSNEAILNSFLPYQWTFTHGPEFAADFKYKTVRLNPDRILKKGGIFTVLHEIGHSLQTKNETKHTDIYMLKLNKIPPNELLRMKLEQNISIHLQHIVNTNVDDPSHFVINTPYVMGISEFDAMLDERLDIEKNAWKKAVDLSEILKQKGIDVLSDFSSQKEVYKFINLNLLTYEFQIYVHKLLLSTPNITSKRIQHQRLKHQNFSFANSFL